MASKIVMMTTRRISPGPPADRPAVLQLRSAFVVARATPPHQEDDHVPLAVRNITFISADPKRLADFWAAATGCTQRRDSGRADPDGNQFCVVQQPPGD
jgi:hypothetical protein